MPLADVTSLTLYRAKFPKNSPRYSVGRKNHTFIEFTLDNGESVHVRMKGFKRSDAIAHLLTVAAEQRTEVQDQREEVPRFRVHNPFAGGEDSD